MQSISSVGARKVSQQPSVGTKGDPFLISRGFVLPATRIQIEGRGILGRQQKKAQSAEHDGGHFWGVRNIYFWGGSASPLSAGLTRFFFGVPAPMVGGLDGLLCGLSGGQ